MCIQYNSYIHSPTKINYYIPCWIHLFIPHIFFVLCTGYSPFVLSPLPLHIHRGPFSFHSLLCSVRRKLIPALPWCPTCWVSFGFGSWEEPAVNWKTREARHGSVSSLLPSFVHLISDHRHVLQGAHCPTVSTVTAFQWHYYLPLSLQP